MKAGARWGRWEWLVLLAVLGLGLMHLPHPFERDQAFFTLGAQRLAAGGVLYRDFWDVKQPGIYWFYLAAGRLFGFGEVGVHLLELLWMMTLAVTLLVTLRRRWGPGPSSTLAPLFTVGVYYVVCDAWHLTQIEGLVGLPLYLALWLATPAAGEEPRAWRSLLSGLCGALVLLFKLVLAPILLAFWLMAFLDALRRPRGAARAALAVALPVALGVALPLAGVTAWFAQQGLLGTLRWTFVGFPAMVVAEVPGTRVYTLFRGVRWFLLRWAPLLGLAVAGFELARRDRLALGLSLWVPVGLAVILAQRVSWWEYHYLLLFVPLGALAAAGVGRLWARLDDLGATAALRGLAKAVVTALCAALIALAGMKLVLLARAGFAVLPRDRVAYEERMSQLYQRTTRDLALLTEPGRVPGPIFVLDNPLAYLRSPRPVSAAFKGMLFPEVMGEAEWSVVTSRLERDPPAYILVEPEYVHATWRGEPTVARFAEFLAERYRVTARIGPDIWYERLP